MRSAPTSTVAISPPIKKRELTAKLLKAKPEASNRQIAKQVKIDDKTVASVRREMEARSEIPNVEARTDTKGRVQPATKPKGDPKPATGKQALRAAMQPDVPEAERDRLIEEAARLSDEERKAATAEAALVVARWRRDADVITVAKCILGTLKYEPHRHDIGPLIRALTHFINPQESRDRPPSADRVKMIADRAEAASIAGGAR
jgi:hypothetical protein